MKWYIWAMIGVALVVIGYFGYKMFTKSKDVIDANRALGVATTPPRILTNSSTQNSNNNNSAEVI